MRRRTKIALAGLLILITWWLMVEPPRRSPDEWTPEEKSHVTKRMKHHGIEACIKDAAGYYFIRNGQRCPL